MSNEERTTLAQQLAQLLWRGDKASEDKNVREDKKVALRQDIVIGLDFGTSCTKVVVQDPSRRTAWAVPFAEFAVKGNPYLLPTKVIVGTDGTLTLSGKGTAILDLKIALMSAAAIAVKEAVTEGIALTARQLCAAYLALIVRLARSWFSRTTSAIYGRTALLWQLNLGVPSSSLSDSNQIDVFKQVARAAWALSQKEGPLHWRDVVAADQASLSDSFAFGLDRDHLNVYPEIAAEVSGYARSDARQSGLHLMVDIGASTLDVSTFILFDREGADNFSFLVTDVQKRGSFYLHRSRVESLERLIRARFDPLDMLEPIPDDARELLPTDADAASIDGAFSSECRTVLGQVISTTKANRAGGEPQFRPREPTSLPVFFCGGGSLVKFYGRVLTAFDRSLRKSMNVGAFDIQPLPMPRRLNAPELATHDYHRLAVAYGLSFRYLDLATVIPPAAIPNLGSSTERASAEMVTKDMV